MRKEGHFFIISQHDRLGTNRTKTLHPNTAWCFCFVAALSTLDASCLQPYEPYSKLRDMLPLVWLWHRYEVEVASKTLGGVEYQHVVKGGANADAGRSSPTSARQQWASLRALLRSVQPTQLTMSRQLIDEVLPPVRKTLSLEPFSY